MRNFAVDRSEARLMGVCAGLANMLNVDPTIVRIGFVVATLLGGWPWTVIAYVALGIVGNAKLRRLRRRRETHPEGLDHRPGERERQLAEIEACATNERLAREIENLR